MEKTELTTVPTFTFKDGIEGFPIAVNYYSHGIQLEQDGENICIPTDCLAHLFKEIKRHLPEAQKALNR